MGKSNRRRLFNVDVRRTSFRGEGGIRTLDRGYPLCRFSKPVPSATRPPLQERCGRAANFAKSGIPYPDIGERHKDIENGWEKQLQKQPAIFIAGCFQNRGHESLVLAGVNQNLFFRRRLLPFLLRLERLLNLLHRRWLGGLERIYHEEADDNDRRHQPDEQLPEAKEAC